MNYKLLTRLLVAVAVSFTLLFSVGPFDARPAALEPVNHVTDITYSTTLNWIVNDSSVRDIIATAKAAGRGDVVHILLHSPGGLVYSGFDAIDAIIASEAKFYGTIPRMCASMCAMISIYLDEVKIYDDAQIMFHWYSYDGIKALPGTFLSKIDPYLTTYFEETFEALRDKGLLTDIEYRAILKGYDIYIDGKEYSKRLERAGK